MPRRLVPMTKPWGRCTLRRKCPNTAAFFYEVPGLTRGRNLSVRAYSVCPECAEIIRRTYPNVETRP